MFAFNTRRSLATPGGPYENVAQAHGSQRGVHGHAIRREVYQIASCVIAGPCLHCIKNSHVHLRELCFSIPCLRSNLDRVLLVLLVHDLRADRTKRTPHRRMDGWMDAPRMHH